MAKPTRSFPALSRTAGNRLHLSDRQVHEVARLADAGLRDDDGSRREVDSGGQCGRSEDGIEAAMTHQFFNRDFPRRQMACVMRRHADALDGRNERMIRDAGILGDHLVQHVGDGLLTGWREKDAGDGRRPASLHRTHGAT